MNDNVIVNPEEFSVDKANVQYESLFWQNKVVWILHWNMAYVGLVNEINQLLWKFCWSVDWEISKWENKLGLTKVDIFQQKFYRKLEIGLNILAF